MTEWLFGIMPIKLRAPENRVCKEERARYLQHKKEHMSGERPHDDKNIVQACSNDFICVYLLLIVLCDCNKIK
jgi:hypothetical protein